MLFVFASYKFFVYCVSCKFNQLPLKFLMSPYFDVIGTVLFEKLLWTTSDFLLYDLFNLIYLCLCIFGQRLPVFVNHFLKFNRSIGFRLNNE